MGRLSPRAMAGCFPIFRLSKPMSNSCTRSAAREVSAIAETLMTLPNRWARRQPVGPSSANLWLTTLRPTGRSLGSHANLAELHNARSPKLNIESLYGDGPTGNPFLYQRDDPAKFLLGLHGADVQRNADGIAVIGDPRNDSHMLISQLHLAVLKAHNAFVDEARLAEYLKIACSTKQPGNYAGTISGLSSMNFCLRWSERHL